MAKELCKCRHVTKKDIKQAVKDGASTVKEVRKATGAGSACGGCRKKVKKYAKKCIKKYGAA